MKYQRQILIFFTLFTIFNQAQSLPSVSVLGDSYSTFDGYMSPNTNNVWYFTSLSDKTDVVSVK